MKKIILLVFLIWPQLVEAQLSMDEFLASALADHDVVSYDQKLDLLSDRPYRLAPVQRLEVRTQNRELNPQQQEYALRLSPANPWEVRNNNRYFKSYEKSLSLEREITLKESLETRYRAIIRYSCAREMLKLLKQDDVFIQQRLQILEQQSGTSHFDPDDYVDLQLDQIETMVDHQEVALEVSTALHGVKRLSRKLFNDTLRWNVAELVTPAFIKSVVDSLVSDQVPLALRYQDERVKLAASEYKLEKSNINVGFLQTEFDNRRVHQDRTPVNVAMGLTIPIFNPNKGDMTRRRLEMIESEQEMKEVESGQQFEHALATDQVKQLLEQHRAVTARLEQLQTNTLAQTLSTLSGSDPRVILQYRSNLNKLKMLQVKIFEDLLNAYVSFLFETDRLQQQPLVNYLSTSLTPLNR